MVVQVVFLHVDSQETFWVPNAFHPLDHLTIFAYTVLFYFRLGLY